MGNRDEVTEHASKSSRPKDSGKEKSKPRASEERRAKFAPEPFDRIVAADNQLSAEDSSLAVGLQPKRFPKVMGEFAWAIRIIGLCVSPTAEEKVRGRDEAAAFHEAHEKSVFTQRMGMECGMTGW